MGFIRKTDLPKIGSSYNFVGSDHDNVGVSIFFVEAEPGRGAPLHVHDYDEIMCIHEGRSRVVLGNLIQEAGPSDIVVIKAHTPHGFVNTGDGVLKQTDIHMNHFFAQQNLEPTEASRKAGIPLPNERSVSDS